MTSKKSLHNTFGYTYKSVIKSRWFLSLAYFIVLLLFFSSPISDFFAYKQALKENDIDFANKLKTAYIFEFAPNSYELESIMGSLISIAIIISAACLAIVLFGYMLNKKAVNVYYSLGMSRNKLFVSKYLAGLTLIALGVTLPIIVSALFNVALYGSNAKLWFATFYIIIRLFAPAMYSFTAMALAISLLGSYVEAVVMGVVTIASPLFMYYTVGNYMEKLIFGSPYTRDYIQQIGGAIRSFDFDLFSSVPNYLVPMMVQGQFSKYMCLRKQDLVEVPQEVGKLFTFGAFKGTIIFLLVIFALALITVLTHKNRKMEKAGFMGMSPVLEGFCVLTVGPFLAVLAVEIFSFTQYKIALFIASVLIMVIGYTVVDLICVRSFKTYIKRIKNLGIEILAFAAIFLIFITGIFGTQNYIPTKSKIEKVAVTVSGNPVISLSTKSNYNSATLSTNNVVRFDRYLDLSNYSVTMADCFTDNENIEKILEINKGLKTLSGEKVNYKYSGDSFDNQVIPTRIRFAYTLKNGKVVEREYNVTTDAILRELAELTTTENFKNYMYENLTNENINEFLTRYDWDIAIMSPNMSQKTVTEAFQDLDARKELFEALGQDIKDGTLPVNCVSNSPVAGYISVVYGFHDIETDENGIDIYLPHDNVNIDPANYWNLVENSLIFPVHENMQNTLNVLKKYGADKFLANTDEPISITYVKYKESMSNLSERNIYCQNFVTGKIYKATDSVVNIKDIEYMDEGYLSRELNYDDEYLTNENNMPDYATTVTDKEKIKEIEKDFRLIYPTCYDGYYVRMIFADGTYVYGYMPV